MSDTTYSVHVDGELSAVITVPAHTKHTDVEPMVRASDNVLRRVGEADIEVTFDGHHHIHVATIVPETPVEETPVAAPRKPRKKAETKAVTDEG